VRSAELELLRRMRGSGSMMKFIDELPARISLIGLRFMTGAWFCVVSLNGQKGFPGVLRERVVRTMPIDVSIYHRGKSGDGLAKYFRSAV
jgi:hypothetical protein